MSVDPLYTFLYSWADQIINTEQVLGVPIIQSHQDAPEPEANDVYLVIDYAPNRTKIGRPSSGEYNETAGHLRRVNDYSLVVEIWEVNGTGSLLRLLIDSIDRQDIKDLWTAANYAYYTETDIQNLPRTQENQWKRESMVELTIGTAEGTDEDTKNIENVEYTGTIPAQGRSGDHIITNT